MCKSLYCEYMDHKVYEVSQKRPFLHENQKELTYPWNPVTRVGDIV